MNEAPRNEQKNTSLAEWVSYWHCNDSNRLLFIAGPCVIESAETCLRIGDKLATIADNKAVTIIFKASFDKANRTSINSYRGPGLNKGLRILEKVRKATQLARERRPDLKLVGPIQYDAAVDMSVAAKKMPGSEVAGQASVFIFPDLNTGNNTYKAVQRETGAIAIGPVLQGLNKPVNDLSRGCTVEDIINTVAITAIQAQNV